MVPHIRFGAVGIPAQPAPQPEQGDSDIVPSPSRDLPPDLPDEPVAPKLTFTSRRKAELLPPIRPAAASNEFDPTWCRKLARADWQAGFRWGVVAAVGGLALFAIVAAQVLR